MTADIFIKMMFLVNRICIKFEIANCCNEEKTVISAKSMKNETAHIPASVVSSL